MRTLGSSVARGVFAFAMVLLASRAEATVTQVDGQIVPVTTRVRLDHAAPGRLPEPAEPDRRAAPHLPRHLDRHRRDLDVHRAPVDTGAGAAILPQIIASQAAGKPAAVTVWTDFRANQVDGDVYAAVSH